MKRTMTTALQFAALAAGLGLTSLIASDDAKADGNLTVYCSPQEEWCQLMVNEFQKASGITVSMTR